MAQPETPADSPATAPPGPISPLTRREKQIVVRIGMGQKTPQIAASLSEALGRPVAIQTVRAHIKNLGIKFVEPAEYSLRERILLWVRWRQWERHRKASDG